MTWNCAQCAYQNEDDGRFCGNCGAQRVAPSRDPRIGSTVLGRYRITAMLGEGAMGAVYRAEQRMGTTVRPVAIKVLHAEHTADPASRARFLRECEVVVQLEHPNTIKFFDFGDLPDGSLAIVMEHIDGESLADRLTRGLLSHAQTIHIVGQICGSLHEAHARGIVHRDLKPENILLTSRAGQEDFVKVCDFGIAKMTDAGAPQATLTMQGTVIGTPPYMSPEQLSGRELDARADLYSLGILVYEMLTGRYPFQEAKTVFEWAQRHLHAKPIPIGEHPAGQELPPRSRAAIMRALEKSPDARQNTVLEFARDLIGRDQLEVGWGLSTIRPPPPAGARPVAATTPMPSSPGSLMPLTNPGVAPTLPSFAGTTSAPGSVTVLPKRSRGGLYAILVLSVLLGAMSTLGAYFLLFYEREPIAARPPAPRRVEPEPEPEPEAEPEPEPAIDEPRAWLRIVHFQRRVDRPASAIGAPDAQTARIDPNGVITLELLPGTLIATDGASAPDLYVSVDETRSGPYRVEIAEGHEDFREAARDVGGTVEIDLDHRAIGIGRYVRISSGSRPVYLDAVGVYRTSIL